jgi:hypothetical protein
MALQWHYQQNALTNAAALPQPAKDTFLGYVNELIFNHFESEQHLKHHFARLHEVATANATALKFVNTMFNDRYKMCFFYTKNVFTCGHTSSVRSESKNSVLKGGGTLKKELKETDLVNIVSCYHSNCSLYRERLLGMLLLYLTLAVQCYNIKVGHSRRVLVCK